MTDASLPPVLHEINVRSGTPHSRSTGRTALRNSRTFTAIAAGSTGRNRRISEKLASLPSEQYNVTNARVDLRRR
jgi:hypothetical protein